MSTVNKPTVVANNSTPLAFDVSWQAPAGISVTHYQIRYRTFNSGKVSRWVVLNISSQSTSYTVNNTALPKPFIVMGTRYQFSVRACNNTTLYPWSIESAAILALGLPGAPINFKLIGQNGFQISLSWSMPRFTFGIVPILGYVIQSKSWLDSQWTTLTETADTSLNRTLTLTNVGPINIRIAAFTSLGTTKFTELKTSINTPPKIRQFAVTINPKPETYNIEYYHYDGGDTGAASVILEYKTHDSNTWIEEKFNTLQYSSLYTSKYKFAFKEHDFRISIKNSIGNSDYISITNVDKPNVLFDRSAWANLNPSDFTDASTGELTTITQSECDKVKKLLNEAADRWSNFIRIPKHIGLKIQEYIEPSWQGIRINQYEYGGRNFGGWADVLLSVDIQIPDTEPSNSPSEITFSMTLGINHQLAKSYTDASAKAIILHELGHGLGIGIFWRDFWEYNAPPLIQHALDASYYPNTKTAYEKINGSSTLIPVRVGGGAGTEDGHWSQFERTINGIKYKPVTNDIMISSTATNLVITPMSIKALVDFGYEEVNPGSSESPISTSALLSSLSSVSNSSFTGSGVALSALCGHTVTHREILKLQ